MTDVCGNCEVTIKPVVRVIPLSDLEPQKLIGQMMNINDRPFGRYGAETLKLDISATITNEQAIVSYGFLFCEHGWNPQLLMNGQRVTHEWYHASNFDELGIDPSELIDSRYPLEACE